MLGYRPNIIWRACWFMVTPSVMIVIFIYSIISLKPVTYNGYIYKPEHYGESFYMNFERHVFHSIPILFKTAIGWCITALGLSQIPIWMIVSVLKQKDNDYVRAFINAFKPLPNWGPKNPALLRKYKEFIAAID